MPASEKYIQALFDRPSETLGVELKSWLDPGVDAHAARIVKACIALRNFNGGFLLIGFDDRTRGHLPANTSLDIRSLYHVDEVQSLVLKYSSEPFEIFVHFRELKGATYPILEVPSGVTSPVMTKKKMAGPTKPLIHSRAIYVRTLLSNNTASTSLIAPNDMPALMQNCFDNREADIGRFLRRHFAPVSPGTVRGLHEFFSEIQPPSLEETLVESLNRGHESFIERCKDRPEVQKDIGTWEVALSIEGEAPDHSLTDFQSVVASAQLRLTGWPPWLDSSGLRGERNRPYARDGGYEALIYYEEENYLHHLDFWRIHPSGKFYLLRGLDDDLESTPYSPTAGSALDYILVTWRVAEVLAVSKAFAIALGYPLETTTLHFAFRWNGLKGRKLSNWSRPGNLPLLDRTAVEDTISQSQTIPLDTPNSSISEYTRRIISPLFEAFDGYIANENFVKKHVEELLSKRM